MFKRVRLVGMVISLALIMSALAVDSAFAAKGRGGTGTKATLIITPNPAPAFTYVQISGCGYDPAVWVDITVQEPLALGFTSALTDSSGCFSHSWWDGDPYTYTVKTYENASAKNPTLMATATLVVQ
jgi:hypothetical protein